MVGSGGRDESAEDRVIGDMIFWYVFEAGCKLERIVSVSSASVPLSPDNVTIDAGEEFGINGSSQKIRCDLSISVVIVSELCSRGRSKVTWKV